MLISSPTRVVPGIRLAAGAAHMGKDAVAEIAHVGGALAQVAVLHRIEYPRVFLDAVAQRARGPVALFDQGQRAPHQGIAVEHQQQGVEQGLVLAPETAGEAPLHRFELVAHAVHRVEQLAAFGGDVGDATVRHRRQLGALVGDPADSDRNAGGAAASFEKARAAIASAGQRRQLAARLGVLDRAGQLRRQCEQEGDFLVLELARLLLTRHQHPEHAAVVDDRHAEKAVVLGFAGVRDIKIARMARRIVEVQRFGALGDQPDEAAMHRQAHLADRLRAQPIGRREDVLAVFEIGQVDRADVTVDGLAHAADQQLQRFFEVVGAGDLLDDPVQRIQHRQDQRRF